MGKNILNNNIPYFQNSCEISVRRDVKVDDDTCGDIKLCLLDEDHFATENYLVGNFSESVEGSKGVRIVFTLFNFLY